MRSGAPALTPPGLCGRGPASAVGRGTLVVLVGVALWLPPATGRSPPVGLFTPRFAGADGTLTLQRDRVDVQMKGKLRTTRVPYSSITRVGLEDGEALSSRVTATRLLVLGVFALAVKKKRGGTKFLTVESDEVFVTVEVPRKKVNEARKFMAQIEQRRR